MGNVSEILTKISYLVSEHDKRITSNEQMIYNAFSYLYTKIDELNITINSLNDKLLQDTVINKSTTVSTAVASIDTTKSKKIKRKRSLFYFLIKPFKYRKLLKEKLLLEQEIILKQQAIEEFKKQQEKQNKKQQEEHRKKLNNTRKTINNILKTKQ
jgi:hypothetical protein